MSEQEIARNWLGRYDAIQAAEKRVVEAAEALADIEDPVDRSAALFNLRSYVDDLRKARQS